MTRAASALMDCDLLFTQGRIAGLNLPNRMVVAPMTRTSATGDGRATDAMARYYEQFAAGGFGLVITEGIYTDQFYSQGYAHQPGIADKVQAAAWIPVVQAVHAAGGRIFAQLMHAGAIAQHNCHSDETVGPSAVRPKGAQMTIYGGEGAYRTPRAMSLEDIGQAVQGFAKSALFARDVAGFDGIEIHGANGYLIDQFLTDYTNMRSDAYGGSAADRVLFACEVLKAVRAAVGSDFPMGVRLSQAKVNDFDHRWTGAKADAEAIFPAIAAAGPDYLHTTEFEAWRPAFEGTSRTLAGLAKQYSGGRCHGNPF
jgi:2,4-dienoyl-CoA reductase-like NADH-dependent reductase (Old Yellow Enzyme family)